MTNDPNPPDDEVPAPDEELHGDERMYTGEPVDTGEGMRRPQQMNVGFENMEGSGEWPDPDAPPQPGSIGEAEGDPSAEVDN